jgi:hypothetical protein
MLCAKRQNNRLDDRFLRDLESAIADPFRSYAIVLKTGHSRSGFIIQLECPGDDFYRTVQAHFEAWLAFIHDGAADVDPVPAPRRTSF